MLSAEEEGKPVGVVLDDQKDVLVGHCGPNAGVARGVPGRQQPQYLPAAVGGEEGPLAGSSHSIYLQQNLTARLQ